MLIFTEIFMFLLLKNLYVIGPINLMFLSNRFNIFGIVVTVKPCQSRLKFSFALLLGALPCCWRKFVKSNARPSGLYTLLPRNFFGKIDDRLRTRQLKGAEKPARCPESNLSHLKKIVIKMTTE